MNLTRLLVFLTMILGTACGPEENNDHGHDNNHEGEVTPADDACEHMADGPAESITAAGENDDPPAIADSHTRYDVTLSPEGEKFTGRVLFESADATDAHFFVDDLSARVVVNDADGAEVSEDETIPEPPCEEVGIGWRWVLDVGTYVLELEAETETIGVVFVPAGAEEEHEHDHME